MLMNYPGSKTGLNGLSGVAQLHRRAPAHVRSLSRPPSADRFEMTKRLMLREQTEAGGAAIPGRHRNKFHQVKRDIFVTARSCACALCFVHENLSVEMGMNSIITKLVSDQPSAISYLENRLFLGRVAYNNHVGSWAGRSLFLRQVRREESPNSREQCAG